MTNQEAETLLAAAGHGVYGLCLRLAYSDSSRNSTADDLFQEAFAKATAAPLPAPPNSREAYNWLYTIALNVYRKTYGKRKRVALQPSEWWNALPDGENVEQALEAQYDSECIRALVQAMEDKYRIPVILYYWSEWDTQTIAKALHVPHATIRTRLKRAREQLACGMTDDVPSMTLAVRR